MSVGDGRRAPLRANLAEARFHFSIVSAKMLRHAAAAMDSVAFDRATRSGAPRLMGRGRQVVFLSLVEWSMSLGLG